jgi:hypothetical protein
MVFERIIGCGRGGTRPSRPDGEAEQVVDAGAPCIAWDDVSVFVEVGGDLIAGINILLDFGRRDACGNRGQSYDLIFYDFPSFAIAWFPLC